LRPHTTMAIEKVKMAARADQPRVINIEPDSRVSACYLRW
jgi:hypothetical protein